MEDWRYYIALKDWVAWWQDHTLHHGWIKEPWHKEELQQWKKPQWVGESLEVWCRWANVEKLRAGKEIHDQGVSQALTDITLAEKCQRPELLWGLKQGERVESVCRTAGELRGGKAAGEQLVEQVHNLAIQISIFFSSFPLTDAGQGRTPVQNLTDTGRRVEVDQERGSRRRDRDRSRSRSKAPEVKPFCSSGLLIRKWPDEHHTKWRVCGLWPLLRLIRRWDNMTLVLVDFAFTMLMESHKPLLPWVNVKSPETFFQVDHKLLMLFYHTKSQRASVAFRKRDGDDNAEWKC